MKHKKTKNIFSLLLAVAALTRSNLVNATPPNSTNTPQPVNTTSKNPLTTSPKSKQVSKVQKSQSTAITKKPKAQQLTNTNRIALQTFSYISTQANIPFTCDKNKINIPIALQKSTLQIIFFSLDPISNIYVRQFILRSNPCSQIIIPYDKLDCKHEYMCLFSTESKDPSNSHSNLFYSLPTSTSNTKAEKKLIGAPTDTSTVHTPTDKSTSTALTTGKRYEVLGTLNITQDEILKQRTAIKKQYIQNCLKAYVQWHSGKATADCLLKHYKPLADESDYKIHPDYKPHIDEKDITTFEKIEHIIEIIRCINLPDVVNLQDPIKAAIEELIVDTTDKSILQKLLEETVVKAKANTPNPTTTA